MEVCIREDTNGGWFPIFHKIVAVNNLPYSKDPWTRRYDLKAFMPIGMMLRLQSNYPTSIKVCRVEQTPVPTNEN